MIKNRKLIFAGIIVIILVIGRVLYEKVNEEPPALLGTYQSETTPPDIIMMSFTSEGHFEEYLNSELVDSGELKKEADGVYTLKSDKKTDLVITQRNDQFYYYSNEADLYLLKNLDKQPSSIGNSSSKKGD